MNGTCAGCDKVGWLIPLHGDRGGPLRCFLCAGEWNAKYTRRRKWGRIVIKAMRMYLKEGGKYGDIDKLKFNASSLSSFQGFGYLGDLTLNYETDTIGVEVGDITSELLADTLQLTHPDRHAPEHQDLAKRVTQQLLELKPFVFPAPKPKLEPVTAASWDDEHPAKKPSQIYPCELCAETVPIFYCNPCKAEWDKRRLAEREREKAKQRKWYSWRRQREKRRQPAIMCAACGAKVDANRKDARFCSAGCKQKAYRRRVTNNHLPAAATISSRNGEAAP